MANLANPTTFLAVTRRALPWLALATAALFALGLWAALLSPPDYQQGETVKIMYIHVPAAWLSSFIYVVMTAASLGTLVWRHPLADAAQKAAAPLGAGFTFICLVTGSLWGKPMWGAYWVWDARLTSVLVLFILYLGLVALWRSIEDPGRAARAAAILTLVGCVNLPIIKFSVDWWNTLHQREGERHDQQRPQQLRRDCGTAEAKHRGRLVQRVPPVDRELDDRQVHAADQCEDRRRARSAAGIFDRPPQRHQAKIEDE